MNIFSLLHLDGKSGPTLLLAAQASSMFMEYGVSQILTNERSAHLPIVLDCRDVIIYVDRKVVHTLNNLNANRNGQYVAVI